MKHFLIALGFKTPHREGVPVILAAGFDKAALQGAVNNADATFQRFELGAFQFMRKARRLDAPPAASEPDDRPTIEEALALLDRIESLEAKLASYGEQLSAAEQLRIEQEEFINGLKESLAKEREISINRAGRIAELERSATQLPTTTETPSEQAPAPTVSEAPPSAPENSVAESAASDSATVSSGDAGPTLLPGNESPAGPGKGGHKKK